MRSLQHSYWDVRAILGHIFRTVAGEYTEYAVQSALKVLTDVANTTHCPLLNQSECDVITRSPDDVIVVVYNPLARARVVFPRVPLVAGVPVHNTTSALAATWVVHDLTNASQRVKSGVLPATPITPMQSAALLPRGGTRATQVTVRGTVCNICVRDFTKSTHSSERQN